MAKYADRAVNAEYALSKIHDGFPEYRVDL